MNQVLRHNILIAAILTATAGNIAHAQLNKEITIEREIVPEVRAASRLDIFPKALSINTSATDLRFMDYSSPSALTPGLQLLEPATTEAAIPPTPYRGYLDAGYFPAATVGVSAGYGILSSDRTNLDVWGQFNNISYKDRPFSGFDKITYKQLYGALGLKFAQRIGDAGTLSLSTDFAYRGFDNLDALLINSASTLDEADKIKSAQGTLKWDIRAGWNGHNSTGLRYHADLHFGLFNFTKAPASASVFDAIGQPTGGLELAPVHETNLGAVFGASQTIGDDHIAGVEISGDFSRYNHFRNSSLAALYDADGDDAKAYADADGKTIGLITLKPYYRYSPQGGVVSLKVGARVDLSVNSGKAVHVAPDIILGINPTSGFGAWLRIDGGEQMNRLQTLSEFTPYISPLLAYRNSGIPVKGEFGLRIGPFKGAALTLDVAYAAANSWLMPAFYEDASQILFNGEDLRSWKAGVHANWEYRSIVALQAGFETLLANGKTNAWFTWLDRSRSRLIASVSIRPISPLTIDLGYAMALHRRMTLVDADPSAPEDRGEFNLKNRNLLNVGASYAITDAFTVFARVENILDDKAYNAVGVPSQGITGAIGFGWKF